MAWTNEEHIELLRALWEQGLSASQIMRALNEKFRDANYTRNAVIGKATRLHLTVSGGVHRQKQSAPVRKAQGAANVAMPQRDTTPRRPAGNPVENRLISVAANLACAPLPEPEDELTPTCELRELGSRTCRWPIGDPQATNFGFCGRDADGVYCDTHTRRASPAANSRARLDERLGLSKMAGAA